jgi:hypothetical protein
MKFFSTSLMCNLSFLIFKMNVNIVVKPFPKIPAIHLSGISLGNLAHSRCSSSPKSVFYHTPYMLFCTMAVPLRKNSHTHTHTIAAPTKKINQTWCFFAKNKKDKMHLYFGTSTLSFSRFVLKQLAGFFLSSRSSCKKNAGSSRRESVHILLAATRSASHAGIARDGAGNNTYVGQQVGSCDLRLV